MAQDDDLELLVIAGAKHSRASAITRPNITYKNDASTRPL
jgi:hypothetical protein